MHDNMVRILAIPGSLRQSSSSNQVLNTLVSIAPSGVSIEIYTGIGDLPHFNDPQESPAEVIAFRAKIRQADAVLICTPEYAFGVPGSLKNALDWTVSSGEFVAKPVGLITASSQGEKGHAALQLVLTAISARIIPGATLLVSFIRSKIDTHGNVTDQALLKDLEIALQALVDGVNQ
jgi:chromate reductase, NAD(P)H dehydrogenase (quinone)